MPHATKKLIAGAAGVLAAAALSSAAHAQVFSSSSSYNSPYGMTQAGENAPVNPSLRDGNGNLELVNGQFLTSSMSQQSGVQNMNPLTGTGVGSQSMSLGSSSSSQVATTPGGVGNVSTTGTATAIGNSLNVITVGNNNTVVVNSKQVNNGNQTATSVVNGAGQ